MAIQRIVRMTFQPAHSEEFEAYFYQIKSQVANQSGCSSVRLLKDLSNNGVYFTYSIWDSQESLNAYRDAPLFGQVWPKVKSWFAEKPEAWSTEILVEEISK